jgi:hypothetical protein
VYGVQLYRANMLPALGSPGARTTDVPVQVLAPQRDPFVSAPLQTDIGRWVPDLAVRVVPAGIGCLAAIRKPWRAVRAS